MFSPLQQKFVQVFHITQRNGETFRNAIDSNTTISALLLIVVSSTIELEIAAVWVGVGS